MRIEALASYSTVPERLKSSRVASIVYSDADIREDFERFGKNAFTLAIAGSVLAIGFQRYAEFHIFVAIVSSTIGHVQRLPMTKRILLSALVVVAMCAVPRAVLASSIVVSVGNTAPTDPFNGGAPLVSGNTYGSAVISSNFVAPFFTDFCGSETSPPLSNCDKSWTFNYVIPGGETITAASLSVGLWDLDSNQAGNQIALYQVNGGDVLTGAMNTASEALHGGTGAVNIEYDVFTFSLANFGALSGGSATVHITFAGPGGGLFGPTDTNAGAILFSTLNLTTQGSTPPPARTPEPVSLLLMATGLGVGLRSRIQQALRRS